jgi:opacity protein-like surface antigen
MRLKFICAGLFLSVALPALPQAAPSATEGGIPISVGFAYSNYYTDYSRYESGPTVWVDWNYFGSHRTFQGLGVEIEGRDLAFDRTGDNANLREQTGEGGLIYHWRHFDKIEPYGKFLAGLGGIYFSNRPGDLYTHDTRTVLAPGGGVEYRIWRNVRIRGDYEYQLWLDFLNGNAMNPEGVTVGVSYDFSRMHSR